METNYTFTPSELPVGSWVEYNFSEGESDWEAYRISHEDLETLYRDADYFNRYHRPIPLTPEVMERLPQFEGKKGVHKSKGDKVSFIADKTIGTVNVFGLGDTELSHILYLHQLQNLFRALTNTDLIIK